LVELGTLPVSADTLAFFAITPLVTIEGALVKELSHLVGVEVSLRDLASN
jgi:hypothetical protein